jgi:hypothetical protein
MKQIWSSVSWFIGLIVYAICLLIVTIAHLIGAIDRNFTGGFSRSVLGRVALWNIFTASGSFGIDIAI